MGTPALWWKFSGGTGTHLVRVMSPGMAAQEVWLDGSPVQAPPGTTTFTGPGACLIELLDTDGGWVLTVDGSVAESYNPELGPLESPAVAWWKFTLRGLGTHHVRVTGIGSEAQAVFLDGAPLDAPPGTMTFTGPGAALLELQQRENIWVLIINGKEVVHQQNPNSSPYDALHVWTFVSQATGVHEVKVSRIGELGQEIQIDGVGIPAPDGTTMFTGPGGALLQLAQGDDGAWNLLVDGVIAQVSDDASALASEAGWTFLAQATGCQHQMRVTNVGRQEQQVFLDGAFVEAPAGSTMFTGPGGALLELRRQGHAWALFIDGVSVQEHNARIAATLGSAPRQSPSATPAPVTLPQGVSWDAEERAYKANIRTHGRFKCLGSFATPEEAHQRYLEAKAEAEG